MNKHLFDVVPSYLFNWWKQ